MRKTLIIAICLLILNIFPFSCKSEKDVSNHDPEIPLTSNQTINWVESNGVFATSDLERAQNEIPFKITLPTYLPYDQHELRKPNIQGPLKDFQDETTVYISITYGIDINREIIGFIWINEFNYGVDIGNPDSDTSLEFIEINDIQVVTEKEELNTGMTYHYSFNIDNVCITIETHNIPREETNKMVKSMVKQ